MIKFIGGVMAGRDIAKLIPVLERVSALKIDCHLLARLDESISLASKLGEVCVDGIEPIYHVLEKEELVVNEDVSEHQSKADAIKNAPEVVEDFYVAPMVKKI